MEMTGPTGSLVRDAGLYPDFVPVTVTVMTAPS
jgi:hypothetical protein